MSATTTHLLSAASFANCVMTLYLLKVHLQTFLSMPITKKCQILSCDTLVGNERYFLPKKLLQISGCVNLSTHWRIQLCCRNTKPAPKEVHITTPNHLNVREGLS